MFSAPNIDHIVPIFIQNILIRLHPARDPSMSAVVADFGLAAPIPKSPEEHLQQVWPHFGLLLELGNSLNSLAFYGQLQGQCDHIGLFFNALGYSFFYSKVDQNVWQFWKQHIQVIKSTVQIDLTLVYFWNLPTASKILHSSACFKANVTILGNFWKILVTYFYTKVALMFGQF